MITDEEITNKLKNILQMTKDCRSVEHFEYTQNIIDNHTYYLRESGVRVPMAFMLLLNYMPTVIETYKEFSKLVSDSQKALDEGNFERWTEEETGRKPQ